MLAGSNVVVCRIRQTSALLERSCSESVMSRLGSLPRVRGEEEKRQGFRPVWPPKSATKIKSTAAKSQFWFVGLDIRLRVHFARFTRSSKEPWFCTDTTPATLGAVMS
jgi:hypothetical protein